MARNRELLPDKEYFDKVKDIVEHVRKCKINVMYCAGDNYIADTKINEKKDKHNKHFHLNVATPAVKGIEKFTAFNHELGHILMQTPIAEAKDLITSWFKDENGEWKNTDGQTKRYDTFWNVFNVLEDQRIESMMSKLWLANAKRFTKAKKNRGKLHTKSRKNPVDVLLNIRFYREDLVKGIEHNEVYKSSLYAVENTGRMGALIQLAILRPYIDEFFEENKKRTKDADEKLKKYVSNNSVGSVKAGGKKYENLRDKLEDEKEDYHHKEKYDGSDNRQLASKMQDGAEYDEWLKNKDKLSNSNEKELGEMATDSIGDGKSDINSIKDSLVDGSEESQVPSYVIRVKRESKKPNINKHVSRKLRRLFRKVSEIHKPVIGYDGQDIDIETFIENKAKGSDLTKCFIDKRVDHGASILISIDGSGSMGYQDKIDQVRDLVATLYDSVSEYDKIHISANIWSSNHRGDVGMTDINSAEDCKNIVVENNANCSFTPTHLALDYSSKQLKKMKGRKKILIMVTDGHPEYHSGSYKLKRNIIMSMCKKKFLKAKRETENIVILHVSGRGCGANKLGKRCKYYPQICNSCWSKDFLGDCFGKKNVVSVSSIRDASDKIVDDFKHIVTKVLR